MFQSCDFLSFPISFSAKPFLCPEIRARFVQTAPAVRPSACLQSASQKKKKNCELDDRRAEHTELRRPAADRGALWEVFRKKKGGGEGAAKGHLLSGGAEKNQTAFPFRGVGRGGLCVCVCAKPRPENVSSETNNSLSFYNCPNSSRVPLF